MGKYLKKFSTDPARVEYEGSNDYIEPYVSYVEGDNTVHYNKFKAILIATYNVEDTSNPTSLFAGGESMGFPASAIYDKIEIDNEEIDMSDLSSLGEDIPFYGYDFTRGGQHTVKYTLKDQTMLGFENDEETGMPKVGATFIGCPITSVEIPNSVISIGVWAFASCSGLTSVTIPNSVTSIGDSTFSGCESLASVTIPSGVTSIGDRVFYDCTSLTSITIPNSVITIGEEAFRNCNSLTNITIPNGVTSIGNGAFYNCSGLTSVTIGSGVTSISDYTFNYCTGLTSVTIEAATPPTLGGDVFFDTNDCPIYVPSASVETYKAASGWSDYASRIQAIP